MRAPRTVMWFSVSPILCSATSPSGLLGLGLRAVNLGIHDRVGGGEVAIAHLPLVGDDVGGALLVVAPRPHVGAAGKAGEGDVEVVGGAAHHAGGGGGGQLDRSAAALQILARARDQVRDVHEPAIVGRGREHLVGVLVLEVVHARERRAAASSSG